MITLIDKESGKSVGTITEDQLQYLLDQLEEDEGEGDREYAITTMLLDYFEEQNADPGLVSILRSALGNREEMTVVWSTE